MRNVRIEKVTLNVGSGKEQSEVDRGVELVKHLTGVTPIKTITNKRINAWGVRPGIPLGCKLTLRNETKDDLIRRFLGAKDNVLSYKNFDSEGSISFGVHEYFDILDTKYNPKIGITGIQMSITLERSGFRVKKRKIRKTKIPPRHRITQQEGVDFMKQKFGVKIQEEMGEE